MGKWAANAVMISSGIILFCTLLIVYTIYVDPVSTFQSTQLIGLEAGGAGKAAHLTVTRHFCFSQASEAEAIRIFREVADENHPEQAGQVFETTPTLIHLDGGCYVRKRRVDIPDELKAGRYIYSTGLRWTNNIGRHNTIWLDPALIDVFIAEGGEFSVKVIEKEFKQ